MVQAVVSARYAGLNKDLKIVVSKEVHQPLPDILAFEKEDLKATPLLSAYLQEAVNSATFPSSVTPRSQVDDVVILRHLRP